MLNINGCNILNQNHAFTWAGSTTDNFPVGDVECGCGAFIMKAHTGKIVQSDYLQRLTALAIDDGAQALPVGL